MRFDLIVFDLDGVLIDNRVAIRENFNYALTKHGFDALADFKIDSMIGTHIAKMFELVTSAEMAPVLAEEYASRYELTCDNGLVILDGVAETLEFLRNEKIKLALATSKRNAQTQILLRKIGLQKYFDFITGATELLRPKPYPDMLLKAIEEIGATATKTAMIGVPPVDIMAARSAKIYPIAVTSGIQLGFTTMEKIMESKPGIVINSLKELCNSPALR